MVHRNDLPALIADDELLVKWTKVATPWMELPHCAYLTAWRDPYFVPPLLNPKTGQALHLERQKQAQGGGGNSCGHVRMTRSPARLMNGTAVTSASNEGGSRCVGLLTSAHSVCKEEDSEGGSELWVEVGSAQAGQHGLSTSSQKGVEEVEEPYALASEDTEEDTEVDAEIEVVLMADGGGGGGGKLMLRADVLGDAKCAATGADVDRGVRQRHADPRGVTAPPGGGMVAAAGGRGRPDGDGDGHSPSCGSGPGIATDLEVYPCHHETTGCSAGAGSSAQLTPILSSGGSVTDTDGNDSTSSHLVHSSAPDQAARPADVSRLTNADDCSVRAVHTYPAVTQPVARKGATASDGHEEEAEREHMMLIGSGLEGLGGTALVYRSSDLTSGAFVWTGNHAACILEDVPLTCATTFNLQAVPGTLSLCRH